MKTAAQLRAEMEAAELEAIDAADLARAVLKRLNLCGLFEAMVRNWDPNNIPWNEAQQMCAIAGEPFPCPPDCPTNLEDNNCDGIVPMPACLLEV